MITSITLREFRLFKSLEFFPKGVNVIIGNRGSGKTSILEAVMYTTLLEPEFLTLLMSRSNDQINKGFLYEYIETAFFYGDMNKEYFFSEVEFNGIKKKSQLQIWRNDPLMARHVGGEPPSKSPFIFVYESVDSTKLFSRSVPYSKVEKLMAEYSKKPKMWPVHYVPSYKVVATNNLIGYYRQLSNNPIFTEAIESMVSFFDEIEDIRLTKAKEKEYNLVLDMKNQNRPVPISNAPKTIIRILQIITSLILTGSDFFLIDDVEYGLTDEELQWFVGVVTKISLNQRLQLFVTANDPKVSEYFNKALGSKSPRLSTIVLSELTPPVNQKSVRT